MPREWMPESLWEKVKHHMPIPCVDVLLENNHGEILLGWRRILPYRNVWALVGGRIFRGERLETAAARIIAQYGMSTRNMFLVGVFPIRFPSRADISVCIAGTFPEGKATPDGLEFSSFRWTKRLPKRIGANYGRMIKQWWKMKNTRDVLKFSRL